MTIYITVNQNGNSALIYSIMFLLTISLLWILLIYFKVDSWASWWLGVKHPSANARDTGSTIVWEDPTCPGAAKLVCHSYWSCALEPRSHNYQTHVLQLPKLAHPWGCAPQWGRPPQWAAHAPQVESHPRVPQLKTSLHGSKAPAQPKGNIWRFLKVLTHETTSIFIQTSAHGGLLGPLEKYLPPKLSSVHGSVKNLFSN